MGRKLIIIAIIAFVLCPICSFAQEVSVSLPGYNVILNDAKVDNAHAKYPLIVYKGITYFPMTFYQCRFMGIESKWTQEDGLEINKTGVIGEYRPSLIKSKNKRVYNACIADFKIKVNGQVVDNSKQEYPLLVLNNVTYFPLTWKFAVDEFNWDYKFDDKKGLFIKSQNLEVKKLNLPCLDEESYSVCMYNGYYYYVASIKNKKYLYSAQVDNTKKVSKVCDLDEEYIGILSFFKQDGDVYFTYHIGGAVMGSDVKYRINNDNTVEYVTGGYRGYRKYKDGLVYTNYGVPPISGNLYYENSKGETKYIGNEEYTYGWIRSSDGGLTSGPECQIIEDDIYVTAFKRNDESDYNKIYKINMNTNEMKLLSPTETCEFYIVNNKIYFIEMKDKKLYSMGLNGENQALVIDEAINGFEVDNDTIYYVSNKTKELFYKKIGENPKLLMKKQKICYIDLINGYVICRLEEKEDYGLVVFDKNQNTVFKTSDKIESYWIEGSSIIYKAYDTNNNYIVNLNRKL